MALQQKELASCVTGSWLNFETAAALCQVPVLGFTGEPQTSARRGCGRSLEVRAHIFLLQQPAVESTGDYLEPSKPNREMGGISYDLLLILRYLGWLCLQMSEGHQKPVPKIPATQL